MRIPAINNNGSKLNIHFFDYLYSLTMYRDFNSKSELDKFIKSEYGYNRNQYEYYYG